MSELKRSLVEDIFYPAHEPRKASSEYKRVHKDLVVTRNEACWICGIRRSDVLALPKEEQPLHQMETHHSHIEWAAEKGIDIDKLMVDWPDLSDEPKLREWLDSEGNMLVLCAKHHRGSRTGIHMITYPAWQLQRYQGTSFTFIPQS